MRITKSKLQQLIKEEMEKFIYEQGGYTSAEGGTGVDPGAQQSKAKDSYDRFAELEKSQKHMQRAIKRLHGQIKVLHRNILKINSALVRGDLLPRGADAKFEI